jgi:hypothetical protein
MRDLADGESLADRIVPFRDYYALEYLHSFLASLDDPDVYTNGITYVELRLFLF